jgi:hypothetical protein
MIGKIVRYLQAELYNMNAGATKGVVQVVE